MRFTELLEEHGVEYREVGSDEHARPGWVQIRCPFCGRDGGSFHMGYSLAGGHVNCWNCGPQNLVFTLMELTQESYRYCIGLAKGLDRPTGKRPKRTGKLVIPDGVDVMRTLHRKYLRDRGFNPKTIESLWNVLGIGLTVGRLSWRLFIPIIYRGETVSWTTRGIGAGPSDYRSAPLEQESIHHKYLLYGEDYCRQTCVVVEGPTDVWRVGPGAVGTFGTGFTPQQIQRIANYPIRAICFDSSEAAQRRARELADNLAVLPGQTDLVKLDAADPGSAGRREIRKLRSAYID